MATRKLFTGLLKWDIMCLFDIFYRSWWFNLKHFTISILCFLRMAPIFTSRIYPGTHKCHDFFSKLSVHFNLASYRFISQQPIHGAASQKCTDVLLVLIAWGATGNERNRRGSVISTNIFLCLLFHDQNPFFSPKKKVGRLCISHQTQACAGFCVRWTASSGTQLTTKARRLCTKPWNIH